MVTARFKVSRVTPWGSEDINSPECSGAEIEMTPDYAKGKNAEWAQATPSGVMRISVTNKAAIHQLPLNASLEIAISVIDGE